MSRWLTRSRMNKRITRGEDWLLASCRFTTVREETTPAVVIVAPAGTGRDRPPPAAAATEPAACSRNHPTHAGPRARPLRPPVSAPDRQHLRLAHSRLRVRRCRTYPDISTRILPVRPLCLCGPPVCGALLPRVGNSDGRIQPALDPVNLADNWQDRGGWVSERRVAGESVIASGVRRVRSGRHLQEGGVEITFSTQARGVRERQVGVTRRRPSGRGRNSTCDAQGIRS
jgi:hypothetical protein